MTRKVSNSELQAFKRCRRKWWMRYVLRLRPRAPRVTGALVLGTWVHDALESMQNGQDWRARLKELHDEAAMTVAEYGAAEVKKQYVKAFTMVEAYELWVAETGVNAAIEILEVEKYLEWQVTDWLSVIGKLDLTVRNKLDGALAFVDYKTCANAKDMERELHQSEQFLMYMLLLRETSPEGSPLYHGMADLLQKTSRLRSEMNRRVEVYHSQYEVDAYKLRLLGMIKELTRLERELKNEPRRHLSLAYPNPKGECAWDCEFATVCPLLDDRRSDAKGAIHSLFVAGDPYDYYGSKKETT